MKIALQAAARAREDAEVARAGGGEGVEDEAAAAGGVAARAGVPQAGLPRAAAALARHAAEGAHSRHAEGHGGRESDGIQVSLYL